MVDGKLPKEIFQEKSLHELNLEQREINRHLNERADYAARLSADAVRSALTGFTPSGKRVQKNLRGAPVPSSE